MREEVFKDTRLLDALEYIDDEYIASAARYKMRSRSAPDTASEMTRRTPFKHWKQFVALAASLILLSMAFPVVTRFVSSIGDFFAGRGSGTTDPLEIISTDDLTDNYSQEETNTFFWMFTPELEPLTQEQVDACNKAYRLKVCGTLEEYIATFPEDKKQYAEEAYNEVLFISTSLGDPYLGTFNGAIVSAWTSPFMESVEIVIGNYVIYFPTVSGILVYKEGEICDIVSAYQNGWLTDDNIKTISERVEKYNNIWGNK